MADKKTKKEKEDQDYEDKYHSKGLGGWANTGIGPGGCFSSIILLITLIGLLIICLVKYQLP